MRKSKNRTCWQLSLLIATAVATICVQSTALADPAYEITVDTANLAGTNSTLAFDFIAGGGSQSNSVSITNFLADGALLPASSPTGSVSGSLADTLTLTNASFFNEQLQGLTLGSTISFQLSTTTNVPSAGSLPDTLSFFVLDPSAASSLVTTADPTGSDSLFTLQIGNALDSVGNYISTLSVFDSSPSVSVTTSAVSTGFMAPEIDPSSAVSAITMLLGGLAVVRARRAKPGREQ